MDFDHPWHAGPAVVGFAAGWLPFLPLAAVEDAVTGSRNISNCPAPEGFGLLGYGVGFAGGMILGTPFYLLGLPFEGGEASDEKVPRAPASPGDRGPVERSGEAGSGVGE